MDQKTLKKHSKCVNNMAMGLAFPLVENCKVRKFGNGEKVKVGIDPWVPSGQLYKLPDNDHNSSKKMHF